MTYATRWAPGATIMVPVDRHVAADAIRRVDFAAPLSAP
jgi:hypothetical protein